MSNISSSKQRGAEKLARIPIKVVQEEYPQKKPDWIRIQAKNTEVVEKLKAVMREHRLVTVCEEASCPNLYECFNQGTATFMIMGDKCTRRCAFCDVGHGRPDPLDPEEPRNLAKAPDVVRSHWTTSSRWGNHDDKLTISSAYRCGLQDMHKCVHFR